MLSAFDVGRPSLLRRPEHNDVSEGTAAFGERGLNRYAVIELHFHLEQAASGV